jgi:dipeptidyl aminopeptidase/acylaminoacyl peptidase
MNFQKTFSLILSVLVCFIASVPAAFAKRGITIDNLVTIQDVKTMSLSPDGKYVAFQTMQARKGSNDYTVGWYIAATKPNAKLQKVAVGSDAVLADVGQFWGEDIIWSLDSAWIYFIKKHDGEVQIWRSSRDRPAQEQLTHNQGDIQSLKISPDGSKILFTIGRTRAELENLTSEGAKLGYLQQLTFSSPTDGAKLAACTDGRERVESPFKNKNDACRLTVWAYELASGVERVASDDEAGAFLDQDDSLNAWANQGMRLDEVKKMISLSPDGIQQAWIENDDPDVFKGFFPLMVVSASVNGEDIRCPATACKGQFIKGLWWAPDDREVIFLVQDGRHDTLYSFYGWIPGEISVRTILSDNDRYYDCDLKGEKLVCGQETWVSPRKIVSIDLSSGDISTIADVNPDFRNLRFTRIEKLFAEDDEGYLAHAHLVYPKGYKKGKKYPLIITQYRSYGFLRGAVGDEQPIHVYAQNGMAVLSYGMPDYYPWDTTLDPVETNGAAYKYGFTKQGYAIAIEHLVDELVARGIVDPQRIGISGLSNGASITDLAVTRKNYTAASTAYSNMTTTSHMAQSSLWGKIFANIYGNASQVGEGRRKHVVDAHADKIDTPYLIQVADREYYSTIHNYLALKDAGKPVEMIVYPDERHVKWQPIHKYMVYRRNLDWFNFWLRGVEDDDPEKAEQYVRWRKLREMHEANLAKLETVH